MTFAGKQSTVRGKAQPSWQDGSASNALDASGEGPEERG